MTVGANAGGGVGTAAVADGAEITGGAAATWGAVAETTGGAGVTVCGTTALASDGLCMRVMAWFSTKTVTSAERASLFEESTAAALRIWRPSGSFEVSH